MTICCLSKLQGKVRGNLFCMKMLAFSNTELEKRADGTFFGLCTCSICPGRAKHETVFKPYDKQKALCFVLFWCLLSS